MKITIAWQDPLVDYMGVPFPSVVVVSSPLWVIYINTVFKQIIPVVAMLSQGEWRVLQDGLKITILRIYLIPSGVSFYS